MADAGCRNLAQLAGAAAFDSAMQRIGAISAAAYDRDESNDCPAMAEALKQALQTALKQEPAYQLGFLLPLADLIDCQLLGVTNGADWSGVRFVHGLLQKQLAA